MFKVSVINPRRFHVAVVHQVVRAVLFVFPMRLLARTCKRLRGRVGFVGVWPATAMLGTFTRVSLRTKKVEIDARGVVAIDCHPKSVELACSNELQVNDLQSSPERHVLASGEFSSILSKRITCVLIHTKMRGAPKQRMVLDSAAH